MEYACLWKADTHIHETKAHKYTNTNEVIWNYTQQMNKIVNPMKKKIEVGERDKE